MTMSNVSRRDFFKAGGLAGIAAGVAGLGIGSVLGVPEEAVAEAVTVTDFVYTCPVCGQKTTDYDSLVKHFEEAHPDASCGIPQCAVLNINGNEIKVQVEPQWTLRQLHRAHRRCAGTRLHDARRPVRGACHRDFRGHRRRRALPPPG